MREPDVTLTDFGLALLCAGFVAALVGDGGASRLFAGLFASLGMAAVFGALWHGWFRDTGRTGDAIWLGTLLAVGAANAFLWLIAGRIVGLPDFWVVAFAAGELVLYAGIVLFVARGFLIASASSLPPTLALLGAFAWAGIWTGAAGLALALAAAGLQGTKVGLPRLRLTHNGLYHVLEAVAFTLVFLAAPAVAG